MIGDIANGRAKIGSDSGAIAGGASVTRASGVCRERIRSGSTTSSTTHCGSVTSVTHAQVVGSRNARGRGLGNGVAAGSNEGGLITEVGRSIATINRRTLVARAQSTAASASGGTSTTGGLARGCNETSYQRGQVVPVGSTKHVLGLVVGNDEQLSSRIDGSYTNSEDGKSRYSGNSVINGPLEIIVQSGYASGFTVFATSDSTNHHRLTMGFTGGIADRLRWRLGVFNAFFVVVTISQDNHDLLTTSTNGSGGCLGGHHISTVNDTGRDRCTHSATGSCKRIDDALRVRSTLESVSSGNHRGLIVTVGEGNGTIPSKGVEVGHTEIDLSRTVGESVYQILRKLFLNNELGSRNRGRPI